MKQRSRLMMLVFLSTAGGLAAQPDLPGLPPAIELLKQEAEAQDALGPAAPAAYTAYAAALEKAAPRSPEHVRAVERGLTVSIRDGDLASAALFASQMRALGREPVAAPEAARPRPGEVSIPGGLEALAFVARANANSSQDRFFVNYCRAIISNTSGKAAEAYVGSIRDYFRRVAELIGSSVPGNGRVRVTISLQDNHVQKEAERILQLLGWQIKVTKDAVEVRVGENVTLAERQVTTSALGIDEVSMQEALQSRKPFTFEIRNESANILFDEKTWRAAFYPNDDLPGGLAEALAREPRVAKLYLALSTMDGETAASLVSGIGLKKLAEKYSGLLFRHASSLASGPDGMVVPGGAVAAPVWTALAGVSPREPGRFLHALLDKDNGRMLGFYSAVAQLDAVHQRFFTRNTARARKFYTLFREPPDSAAEVFETFTRFLREVPLDGEGRVNWPGNSRVWTGTGPNLANAAAAQGDDDILLRLERSTSNAGNVSHSELNKFIMLSRLNRRREEPLDESSALMLAQNYGEYGKIYPYFAVLTGLGTGEFRQFFSFGEAVRHLDPLKLNSVLGAWHGVTGILCLTQQAGAVSPTQAAALFRTATERFAKTVSAPDFRAPLVAASLDSLRDILRAAGPAAASSTADEAIRNLLAGNAAPAAATIGVTPQEIDFSIGRRDAFERVLELQKVTTLEALYGIYNAAQTLAAGKPPYGPSIRAIDENRARLLTVEVPKNLGVQGNVKDELVSFRPARLAEAVAALKQKTAAKTLEPKEAARLSEAILVELSPHVRWTLTGLVYAAYLRPDDLLVSDDPLFVRKHQYCELELGGGVRWAGSLLNVSSDGAGSYIVGGFAGFSTTAGRIAILGRNSDDAGEFLRAAQYGAIRAGDYRRLRDEDLRLLALTVRAAREWIVQSATTPEIRDGLAESTLGLLSLGRSRRLLNAIAARDWRTVADAVTLSDLYFLGRRYLARYETDPWISPVLIALRRAAASNDGSRLDGVGAYSRLIEQSPYEEFEHVPAAMAERMAELTLYIADRMNAAGLLASAFGAIAEPIAREVLKKTQMSDTGDWHSVTSGFARLDVDAIREIVSKQ